MKGKSGVILYGLYQYYRNMLQLKGYMDKKSDYNVSFKQYSTVLRLFNQKIKDALIHDSWIFTMPFRLGTLYIKKIKMEFKLKENGDLSKKGLVPNWEKTYALWERLYPGKTRQELKQIPNKRIVYHLNEHTYGYKFVIHWAKKHSNIRGHGIYEFIFAKDNRRELARVLKSNPNITYYE